MGESVQDRIVSIIEDQLGVDDVTPLSNFQTDLGADSLDVIEVVMAIEEEFDIEIPDEDYDNGQLATVGLIINYVELRLKKKA